MMSERSEYLKGLHSKENVGRISKMLGLPRATILKIPTKDLDKLITKISVANTMRAKKNKGGVIQKRKTR